MSWEKSETMEEFLKIASEQNLLKEALPEKNPYQEDLKTIEEKRLDPPEKSIIEEAHPEPVYVAESRGDGGLVENQLEQQKKLIQMINKMPNGNIVGRYAQATAELVKLANACDELGEMDAANLLTDLANKLTQEMARLSQNTDAISDTAHRLDESLAEDLEGPFEEAPESELAAG